MKEIKYVVKDAMGIHARPAGLLIKEAGKFTCTINIKKDTKEVDAKRIIGVMGLGVKQGDEITVTFDGPDEEDAAKSITDFLRTNL